jgi:hypothetical protein
MSTKGDCGACLRCKISAFQLCHICRGSVDRIVGKRFDMMYDYPCSFQPFTKPSRLISPIDGLFTSSDTTNMPMSSTLTPSASRYCIVPSMPISSGAPFGSSRYLSNNLFNVDLLALFVSGWGVASLL